MFGEAGSRFLRLVRKPGVLAPLSFGLSGLAFIVANLLLARFLSVEQYALIALLMSIQYIFSHVAPLGADGLVSRGTAVADRELLRRVALTSIGIGALAAVFTTQVYTVDWILSALLLVCIGAGGVTFVVAAQLQADQAFGRSLLFLRSPDYALLIAAVVSVVLRPHGAVIPFAAVTIGMSATAIGAWRFATWATAKRAHVDTYRWKEATAYLAVQMSGELLMHLERLLTGKTLGLDDLATLGVVLSIIGPPFRLLQLTTGYALQAQLRAAQSRSERIQLLTREGVISGAIVLASSAILWPLSPWLVSYFLPGKYTITSDVMLAVLVGAVLRVAIGFSKACVTALATNRELAYIGVASWFGVGIAIAAGVLGSRFGLAGLIYGVTTGWAVRVLVSAYFVARRLRRH